jgi:hypothetical protein
MIRHLLFCRCSYQDGKDGLALVDNSATKWFSFELRRRAGVTAAVVPAQELDFDGPIRFVRK